MSPPAPSSRPGPPRQRRSRPNIHAVALLLSVCLALSALSTVRLHGRLHRHHHDDVSNGGWGFDVGGARRMGRASLSGTRGAGGDGSVGRSGNVGVSGSGKMRHNNTDNNTDSSSSSSSSKGTEGLSACLLVNDENPRLPEWLAYHYTLLPLRSLIVAVDPASRSSPLGILETWRELAGLDVTVWEERDFLPRMDGHGEIRHGACDGNDPEADCLWSHRKRQRYFVKRCMADFKRRNRTWVLLVDVDEYVTFNAVEDDDPPLPLDYAPEGVPTLSDWKRIEYQRVDDQGRPYMDVSVEGTISGLPEEGRNGTKNGDRLTTSTLVTAEEDYYQGTHGAAYGNVVEDKHGHRYFLRDDWAFRDAVQMAQAPGGVPTLKGAYLNGTTLHATIYGDHFSGKKDGESVEIQTNWRDPPAGADTRTLFGGHLINGADRRTYFVETARGLWPPHLSSEEHMAIRRRLPSVGEGKTIRDVLESEAHRFGDYAHETIGPCLSMPRLLYGSRENASDPRWADMAPAGFSDADFVTLRYRWHAIKEARVNKFQKAIVDVSRLRMSNLDGEAENIHVPLKYYCRKDPPRYSASFLRVNHYLDSFEAYSYRNDARSSKRQCRECYDDKGKEAAASMDDGVTPWLNSFVGSVGRVKAQKLLAGAGTFVRLS